MNAALGNPGVELIERFVAEGEYSVIDVVEAWRSCCCLLAAFYGVTARQFLTKELELGLGIDLEPEEHVRLFVLQKLVDDLEAKAIA